MSGGGVFNVKNVLIGGVSAAGAMGIAAIAAYKGLLPASLTNTPMKAAATNIVLGGLLGYAAAKLLKSPAAGIGIAAGLGGAGLYQAAAPTLATMIGPPAAPANTATASATAPAMGAVEVPYGYQLGAVEIPMGAVEVPMGNAYAPYDSYPVNGGFFAQ